MRIIRIVAQGKAILHAIKFPARASPAGGDGARHTPRGCVERPLRAAVRVLTTVAARPLPVPPMPAVKITARRAGRLHRPSNACWMSIGTFLPSRRPPIVVTYRKFCLSPGKLILEAHMSTDTDTTMTDEQVAAIADRMTEEGRLVSPVTIWAEVRSGSIVAVAAALQRWRETREPQPPAPETQAQKALPGELAETVMEAARRIWTASQDDAGRLLSEGLGAASQQLD